MSANPEKNYEIGLLLDLYGALLSDRQREVTDLYYNDDLSLGEAAEECGITRQGVRDALLKSEEQLKQYEEALGLLRRQRENAETLAKLRAELENLRSAGVKTSRAEELLQGLSL